MSIALYSYGGLRFWSEREISRRNRIKQVLIETVKDSLRSINPAWDFHEIEGPCLMPIANMAPDQRGKEIFETNHNTDVNTFVLRPETTATSYLYSQHLIKTEPRSTRFAYTKPGNLSGGN
jgi:glycyl-tRNA synthetase